MVWVGRASLQFGYQGDRKIKLNLSPANEEGLDPGGQQSRYKGGFLPGWPLSCPGQGGSSH